MILESKRIDTVSMKKLAMAILIVAAAVALFSVCSDDSSAYCTGFYFGSDITEDGSMIIGQSVDVSPYYQVHYEIYEESFESGRCIYGLRDFAYELPAHTYRYTTHICKMILVGDECLGQHAGGGCINSEGVVCIGSITAQPSNVSLQFDPFITTGLAEDTATSIVGACASTAREGLMILTDIIDEKGSAEPNIFIIADQTEAWYLEIYTGHQYAAILLPSDAAIFTGNEYGIKFVEDYDECYVSDGLVSLAVDNGFAVIIDGKLDLEKTYSKDTSEGYVDRCHIRSWRGRNILSPTEFPTYDVNQRFELTFEPESKVSVEMIMAIMEDRNEGTPYSPDDGAERYCIGNYTTFAVHITQIFKDKDKDVCCLKWGEIGFCPFGVFIPMTVGVESHIDEFGCYSEDLDGGLNMYDVTARLQSICSRNMNTYKPAIQAMQQDLQDYIFATFEDVWEEYLEMEDRNKANEYLTGYVRTLERMTYEQTSNLYNDIILWNLATVKDGPVGTYKACYEVSSVAERYGWTVDIDGDTYTLTNGDDVIIIDAERFRNRYVYSDASIDINGTEYTAQCYYIGDSCYLNSDDCLEKMMSHDAKIVIDKEEKKGDDNSTVTVVVIALSTVIIIGIAAIAILIRRHV